MAVSPSATGGPKQRVIKEHLPLHKPSWIPASSKQPVRAGDDRGAFVKQLGRGEADTLPVDLDDAAITSEIVAVNPPLTMLVSVVLVNSSRTNQPQVSPRDKAPPLIEDLLLWLDIYAGR